MSAPHLSASDMVAIVGTIALTASLAVILTCIIKISVLVFP